MITETTPRPVEVGDVFVESWGYGQTNVDTYVVVRKTASSIFLKPCGQELTEDGRNVRPRPDRILEFREEPGQHTRIGKVNANGEIRKAMPTVGFGGRLWMKMTSYSGASRWDGERAYHDTIAAGMPGH